MIPYTVRPLEPWIGKFTAPRRDSPFTATWSDTLDVLDREIRMLGGKSWVLQIDVTERWIRNDGQLYYRAQPNSPAIRVCFDSKHGPQTYPCDAFWFWQANVRAVALSLEALRKVDRYGVASHGEQYRGWTAISNRPHQMSREEAAEFLAHWAGLGTSLSLFNGYPEAVKTAHRSAAKRAHPDVTGDDGDTMARLNGARDILLRGA